MKNYLVVLTAAVFFLGVQAVEASEINYGHIEAVKGETVHIEYRSPAGAQHFLCDAGDLTCELREDGAPQLFSNIDGATDYTKSPDGSYALVQRTYQGGNGFVMFTHTLFDLMGTEPKVTAIVPYLKPVSGYGFTREENKTILYGMDGSVHTYDIENKKLSSFSPTQSSLPLKTLSPRGEYLAAYNYSTLEHRIWDTTSGSEMALPGTHPSYAEFSENGDYVAFTDTKDGFQTLYYADISGFGTATPIVTHVFSGDLTIEDYLWYENELYAVGNTSEDPYNWVLYRFDPVAGERAIVAKSVSYGDYLRPVGDYGLAFLQIDGKNTNVALYDPEARTYEVLQAVEASPASNGITRTVRTFENGAVGVLYEPTLPASDTDLYVWLHGGPERQTSYGYHSYLSYAVYDELLERLTESGAYVLKLDYAGSYGHGIEFKTALKNQVGIADVNHVVGATEAIVEEYDIEDVYAIGNSYGGYLAPKVLVDEPDLYTGAIAINGVFDWFTLTERIPSTPFTSYFTETADATIAEQYERASVIRRLNRLSDEPVLVIASSEDSSVPFWQSREFTTVATAFGKNVTMLTLEGEDHIIRERDSLNTMCRFIKDELSIKALTCEG